MKFKQLTKLIVLLSLTFASVFSLRNTGSVANNVQANTARQDYIYYSPTAANIIDSSRDYINPSYVQYATPYTYTSPSYVSSPSTYTYTVPSYGAPSPYPVPYGTGYYFSPGTTWYTRKDGTKVEVPQEKDQKSNKTIAMRRNGFQDVVNEVKGLKKELFGNSDADMAFYKKNKNAYYDSQWLQRAQKIAKVLELEELLEFYEKNNKEQAVSQAQPTKQASAPVQPIKQPEAKREETAVENKKAEAKKPETVVERKVEEKPKAAAVPTQPQDSITITTKEEIPKSNLKKN